MSKRINKALLAAAILLTAACSDPLAPAAPTPVAPTITDTFTGKVTVYGSISHTFSVQAVGGVDVSLTSVEPSAALGIGVGTPNGAECNTLSTALAVAGAAPQLAGTATAAGDFCVSVFDAGNLVEPVTYTVSVFHP